METEKNFDILFEEMRMLRVAVADLTAQLSEVIKDKPVYVTPETMDAKISTVLHDLKISANLKGYTFLRDALKMIIEDFELMGFITTELYPTIAKKYVTTPSRVERAMRHAIQVSYKRVKDHPYYKDYPNVKPTNGQFLGDMADRFRLEEVQAQVAVGKD